MIRPGSFSRRRLSPTGLTANRKLGQNFLCDQNMIRALCASLHARPDDIVVEFCAGAGALTESLLGSVAQIYAVEIDDRMLVFLEDLARTAAAQSPTRIHIARIDAMAFDLSAVGGRVRVVGNLAYNISVPLLLRCLYQYPHIIDIHVMLQKEVAGRLCARPGQSDYGRLAVMMQAWFDVRCLRRVPPECFSPRPRVDSAFVSLSPRCTPVLGHSRCRDFESLVRQAFARRRKYLINNLRLACKPQQLECLRHCGIAPRARAQDISVRAYADLFKCMAASA